MENLYLTLTDTDRAILDSYKVCLDGLSEYLGNGYEIVLHSLENLDRSAIKVINGHYTGRTEGAPITDLALNMLEKINASSEKKGISYFNTTKNGSMVKSTTIPIIGENKRIIGLLCINLHLEVPFSTILASLTPANHIDSTTENFTDNVEDLIAISVEEIKSKVMVNPMIPVSNKNKEIIMELNNRGIFKLKDAVSRVAELLNISKNTVYLHLRAAE